MTYQELEIKRSYVSVGQENIAKSFLTPALKCTKSYKRSVGFFSSSVLQPIVDGIVALARNNGQIQLIASPNLTEDDIQAISTGYAAREKVINASFTRDFMKEIEVFDDAKLQLLATLIARGTLDIKIAVTDTLGIYHDKLGILEDFDGNVVVFYGSANSTLSGYQNNYEKIRVVKNWIPEEQASIVDEQKEFDSLWNGTNVFVKVYDYKESAKASILQMIKTRASATSTKVPIKLRDYQKEAIAAWVKNNYHGFYVMATGTGKTWTAIYSAKELLKTHSAMVVICAPYKHLVKQWAEDVEKAFGDAKIIMVSSENPKWEQQISQEIIRKKYDTNAQTIIISTIASFKMSRFEKTLLKSNEDKLLIVDEAHRFTDRSEDMHIQFKYMLGLSATPFSGISAQRGKELMEFFGGQVFSLPIEESLERKFLVPYYYHPIYVHASEEDEEKFQYHTRRILSCFKNNTCINPDLLVKSLRNRLRVISMAEEKQDQIDYIVSQVKENDHFVVYCGDGRLFDNNTGEELRHIQSVKRVLSSHGYNVCSW